MIAFPHLYAASFGKLGGREFSKWTRELTSVAGARVRGCVLHQLDYARRLR